MVFIAYGSKNVYTKRIQVAGGGLGNGNSYAVVEIQYLEEFGGEVDGIYYQEYGGLSSREYIGDEIEWGEDDTFKIKRDGEYIDGEDREEEEDEEEEEEEEEEDKENKINK
jgi:hypothetical protein